MCDGPLLLKDLGDEDYLTDIPGHLQIISPCVNQQGSHKIIYGGIQILQNNNQTYIPGGESA